MGSCKEFDIIYGEVRCSGLCVAVDTLFQGKFTVIYSLTGT